MLADSQTHPMHTFYFITNGTAISDEFGNKHNKRYVLVTIIHYIRFSKIFSPT